MTPYFLQNINLLQVILGYLCFWQSYPLGTKFRCSRFEWKSVAFDASACLVLFRIYQEPCKQYFLHVFSAVPLRQSSIAMANPAFMKSFTLKSSIHWLYMLDFPANHVWLPAFAPIFDAWFWLFCIRECWLSRKVSARGILPSSLGINHLL